jgi:hypothetical protein
MSRAPDDGDSLERRRADPPGRTKLTLERARRPDTSAPPIPRLMRDPRTPRARSTRAARSPAAGDRDGEAFPGRYARCDDAMPYGAEHGPIYRRFSALEKFERLADEVVLDRHLSVHDARLRFPAQPAMQQRMAGQFQPGPMTRSPCAASPSSSRSRAALCTATSSRIRESRTSRRRA